ncbi:unnamed protein product [Cuscuta campestris]|uniref:TF-B3 domain-containing protein n=1 Tax=Cuscuta campestris TaxID=132261 RepID=A0A484N113_9ASTE|nr:unnamed protein product [Cuscuta campestris]
MKGVSSTSTHIEMLKRNANIKKLQKRSSPPKKTKVVAKVAKSGVVKREYAGVDNNSPAMRRARELQANLPPEFPSLVKFMLHSHVTGGFWLGLPRPFCTSHLPKHDGGVVLVDGDDKEWETKYLVKKNGLSAGWRGFSIAHNLVSGDVLVFQLLEPCKFKVYIVRENASTDIDFAAISLLNLSHQPLSIETQACLEQRGGGGEGIEDRVVSMSEHGPPASHLSANSCDEDDIGGLRLADSALDFSQVKDFESFHVFANGLIIDSEIPRDLRAKYYRLCAAHKSYLHQNLIQGLNYKLIAGIISETVNIADAISTSSSKLTSETTMEAWDTTLRGFECLGMRVEFLRDRLRKLINLLSASSGAAATKRREQRAAAKAELKDLRRRISGLDEEIELYGDIGRVEMMFKDVATAPW